MASQNIGVRALRCPTPRPLLRSLEVRLRGVSTSSPIIVFTDGAAKGNPGPGGWGAIVVTPDHHVAELGGGSPHTTNNKMELGGAIAALRHVADRPDAVTIYTDS